MLFMLEVCNMKQKLNSSILRRMSPQLTCSRWKACSLLIPKVHRSRISLRAAFFGECLYRKDLSQRSRNSTYKIEQDRVHAHSTCQCIQINFVTNTLLSWWKGNDVLSILHQIIIVCYLYIDTLLCFSYVLGSWLRVLGWRCDAYSFSRWK
jgi:hypothetical protein